MVEFEFVEIDRLALNEEAIENWLKQTVEKEGKVLGDLSLIFCSDDYLLEMNREHLDHDYFTDIITFNYCNDDVVSGDLFISVDRVKENAADHNETFSNELLRVCVHGVLHLIGFNDKSIPEAKEMRKQENLALAHVNFECFT